MDHVDHTAKNNNASVRKMTKSEHRILNENQMLKEKSECPQLAFCDSLVIRHFCFVIEVCTD